MNAEMGSVRLPEQLFRSEADADDYDPLPHQGFDLYMDGYHPTPQKQSWRYGHEDGCDLAPHQNFDLCAELQLMKSDMCRGIQRLENALRVLQIERVNGDGIIVHEKHMGISVAEGARLAQHENALVAQSPRSHHDQHNHSDGANVPHHDHSKTMVDIGAVCKREAEEKLRYFQIHEGMTLLAKLWEWIFKHVKIFFETIMGAAVLLNCVSVGISCDLGSVALWLVVDTIFAAIFSFELIIRLKVDGCREFVLGKEHFWNLFELTLVVIAWVEVAFIISTSGRGSEAAVMLVLIRMFKFARILRLLRVLKLEIFSELVLMVKGALGSVRALLWSIILIFWPLYIMSLIFRETLGDQPGSGGNYFSTVPLSFFTLFRCVIGGDCSDEGGQPIFVAVLESHGWGFPLLYMCLTMFMTFGLFNVITAIYVENVVASAKSDGMTLKKNRRRDQEFFNRKLYDLVNILWDYHVTEQKRLGVEVGRLSAFDDTVELILSRFEAMQITPGLFEKLLDDPRAKEIFQDLEVSDEDQFNMFQALDIDESGTLEIDELFEGIKKLRGPARRSDMVLNEALTRKILKDVELMIESLDPGITKSVSKHPWARGTSSGGGSAA